MSAPSGQFFFISYSRADTALQRKVVAELRGRGVKVWVDTENLVPGSPAWEREIEKSIRASSGVVVLLSPDSNNSQWVRREISFAEENDKQIFPVHVIGDENDSIPLRLSSHQRVDLRRNFTKGIDELADALKDYLGVTAVNKRPNLKQNQQSIEFPKIDWKKYALPGALIGLGIFCLVGAYFAFQVISNLNIPLSPTNTDTNTPPVTDVTISPTAPPTTEGDEPTGKIVYTCGIAGDEVCLINADGSGWRRLTNTNPSNSNASLAPDGNSIVFIRNDGGKTEIYELELASGNTRPLTDLGQNTGSPEISPDGQTIIFHYRTGNVQLWIMNRDGSDPREYYRVSGRDVHDATWSPDGDQILFALGRGENNQLYIMDFDGDEPSLVNDTIDTRGRSDWSVNNLISFDQGGPFQHDVYLMDTNGQGLRPVGPDDMNTQGASISPDGNWIAFSVYTNVAGLDQASCEIFIMRVDGSDLRQLTDNNYCDYQPRWGN